MDICVSIFLTISDESAFRRAAYERALADGLGEEEAKRYLDSEATPITNCAVMLFDPGKSPDGCDIHDSVAE
jgi:hypothetical protein